MSVVLTGRRSDRSSALRRTAWSKHATEPVQTQAPRPGSCRPMPRPPSGRRAIRSSAAGAALRPHPMQLRSVVALTDGPLLLALAGRQRRTAGFGLG